MTVSGTVKDAKEGKTLPFVTVAFVNASDSTFVLGMITSDAGLFSLADIKPGNYVVELSYIGFESTKQSVLVGSLSDFLDLGTITLAEDTKAIKRSNSDRSGR